MNIFNGDLVEHLGVYGRRYVNKRGFFINFTREIKDQEFYTIDVLLGITQAEANNFFNQNFEKIFADCQSKFISLMDS